MIWASSEIQVQCDIARGKRKRQSRIPMIKMRLKHETQWFQSWRCAFRSMYTRAANWTSGWWSGYFAKAWSPCSVFNPSWMSFKHRGSKYSGYAGKGEAAICWDTRSSRVFNSAGKVGTPKVFIVNRALGLKYCWQLLHWDVLGSPCELVRTFSMYRNRGQSVSCRAFGAWHTGHCSQYLAMSGWTPVWAADGADDELPAATCRVEEGEGDSGTVADGATVGTSETGQSQAIYRHNCCIQ